MKAKEPEGYKIQKRGQIYLILIALCFLLYANSLNNVFISDDIPAILKDPNISRPLYYWLYPPGLLNSFNYLIAGYNPFIYHLTNIVLHSLNTILIFIFLNLFFKTEASLLAACLFAAHPIHAEAVTWVSGRPYLITSLFILTAYLLYHNIAVAVNDGRRINFMRYLLCFFIFSYYMIINFSFNFIFPFFLILLDITFGRWRKTWKLWLPFLGFLSLRVLLARNLIAGRISFVAEEIGQEVTWSNPVFNFAYSFFAHMWLLLWPAKLTLYHEPAVISAPALRIELFFLVLLIISLPFIFKKAKELFFGIAVFILFLAPTYSPVMVSWLVAERYLYFPSIILSIFLAFFYERIVARSKRFAGPTLAVSIFVIASFGVRTVARNEDWKTAQSFWRQTALISYNSPRAHNNMGDAYCQEGNLEGGIREFKKAIELKPDYADAYHNLANVYHNKGDLEEAIMSYQQAVSFNPKLFESHYNLGIIYLGLGRFDSAKFELEKALQIRPEDENARQALDMVLRKEAR